jgi:putative FmdB family regulatory protein
MPTYEYECAHCGHKFEKFQSMTAAPIKKCPVCGKNTAKRLIGTGAGLIFKGSGFYITDYRSDSYKERAKSEAGGSSDGKSAESKPSDNGAAKETKPATKSETTPTSKPESKPAAKSEPKPPKTKS